MSNGKKEAYIKASAISRKNTSEEDDTISKEDSIISKAIETVYPSQQSKPYKRISMANNCDDCIHYDVCKYKEDTKNFHVDLPPNITIDCKYYEENK